MNPRLEAGAARTLAEVASWWAAQRPDALALTDERMSLTWAALDEQTSAVAAWMVDGGLRPADRVALVSENRAEWCIAAIAAWKAGAAIVPVNLRLTGPELAELRARSSPRIVLFSSAQRRPPFEIGQHDARWTNIDGDEFSAAMRARATLAAPHSGDADSVVSLQFTSGTTGVPKAVPLRQSSALALGRMLRGIEPSLYEDGLISVVPAPLFFTGGLNSTFIPTFVNGGHLVLQRTFDAAACLALIKDVRATMLVAVPTVMERLAALPEFRSADLSHIVLGLTGGAIVRDGLLRPWHDRGAWFRQGYSLTEGGGFTCCSTRAEAQTHPERAGRPVVDTEVRVVDPAGVPCSSGVMGELLIRGPAVMCGYWNDPDATAATMDGDWCRTGDLAVVHGDGSIQIHGRIKDLIISGGINVYPAEIERVLGDLAGVIEVAVVGRFHEKWGETPVAVLRLDREIGDEELRVWCSDRLASFKIPSRFVRVSEPLPRNPQGKVVKRDLAGID